LQNLISRELAVKAAEYNIWLAQIPYIFAVVEIEDSNAITFFSNIP
jgi:hypothetical protein